MYMYIHTCMCICIYIYIYRLYLLLQPDASKYSRNAAPVVASLHVGHLTITSLHYDFVILD